MELESLLAQLPLEWSAAIIVFVVTVRAVQAILLRCLENRAQRKVTIERNGVKIAIEGIHDLDWVLKELEKLTLDSKNHPTLPK